MYRNAAFFFFPLNTNLSLLGLTDSQKCSLGVLLQKIMLYL